MILLQKYMCIYIYASGPSVPPPRGGVKFLGCPPACGGVRLEVMAYACICLICFIWIYHTGACRHTNANECLAGNRVCVCVFCRLFWLQIPRRDKAILPTTEQPQFAFETLKVLVTSCEYWSRKHTF